MRPRFRPPFALALAFAAGAFATLVAAPEARAEDRGSGSVLCVYLDGAGAPAPLVQRVEDRLRAQLGSRGVDLAALPAAAAASSSLGDAKRDLDKGLAAYRALSLDTAVSSLAAAEKEALAAPESPEAPKILGDARIYLGIIARATGKQAEADRLFRLVAVDDPDRRLDTRAFPPDTVAAFEKARKAVAAGSFGDLALSASTAGAHFLVDGRPVSGATARVAYGEHFLLATSDQGSVGERIEVREPSPAWRALVQPDPAKALAGMRAAAKRGDDDAALRAAAALASAAGAARVLTWDLRSTNGHVEAPMRLFDAGASAFGRAQVADLGTTANLDPGLHAALVPLFSPEVAGGTDAGRGPVPGPGPAPGPRRHRRGHEPLASWIWWTAGGVALIAAGGAAAALSQPPPGGTRVGVTVEH